MDYQKIKYESKVYPWPSKSTPQRTIPIFGGANPDVLQRVSPGIFNCATGIGKLNILIPEEDIVEVKNDPGHLVLL